MCAVLRSILLHTYIDGSKSESSVVVHKLRRLCSVLRISVGRRDGVFVALGINYKRSVFWLMFHVRVLCALSGGTSYLGRLDLILGAQQ